MFIFLVLLPLTLHTEDLTVVDMTLRNRTKLYTLCLVKNCQQYCCCCKIRGYTCNWESKCVRLNIRAVQFWMLNFDRWIDQKLWANSLLSSITTDISVHLKYAIYCNKFFGNYFVMKISYNWAASQTKWYSDLVGSLHFSCIY